MEVEGMKVLMMHIGGYPGRYDYKALQLIESHRPDVFISGHSHILKVINDKRYNMLTINPGAAGIQGFQTVRTALRFRIEKGTIKDMEVGEWTKNLKVPDDL
jgi:predicted phosphodiesterase